MTGSERNAGATIACLAPLLALVGCAEPRFEFRGYTDLSGCADIVDLEMASGSGFVGGFESLDVENPGYVTELSGEVFGEPVRIEVLCSPTGLIESVHYIVRDDEPAETAAAWNRFSAELEALFGPPSEISTEWNRTRRYLCHSPSPIFIDEWVLETEEDQDPEHEIYLAVIPAAAECLDD